MSEKGERKKGGSKGNVLWGGEVLGEEKYKHREEEWWR
jgi:hypothetical protein